jgi:hypothetical protein
MIVCKELLDSLRADLKEAAADAKKYPDEGSEEYVERIRSAVKELEHSSNTIKPTKKMKFRISFSGDGKWINVSGPGDLRFEVDTDDVDQTSVFVQLAKMLSILEENWQ